VRGRLFLAVVTVFVSSGVRAQLYSDDPLIVVQPTMQTENKKSFSWRPDRASSPDDPRMSRDDKARAAILEFASCIYVTDKRQVLRVLDVAPGSTLTQHVRRTVDGRCLDRGFLQVRPSSLRWAFFVAAYRAGHRKTPPTVAVAQTDYAPFAKSAVGQDAGRYLALARFGDCVVRNNVDGAHQLVMATPASAREEFAFGALRPSLSACVDSGSSVSLTKEIVQGVVAEALYRHSVLENRG
jgi:hypothetical protein